MNPKIQEQHRSKPAYIYLRQSTPGQVLHHRESTERQYALREKARELGWSESLIRTLDQDLGKTGTEMTRREDFKTLVADVSMGQVGAVFALEVSRLARSNLDWQRLLELCALTSTLVIDEDGCYDPADFNDGLLLGLKGVMASAELHFLRARLQGGKLHKAQKGELRFPLPVGFYYDAEIANRLNRDGHASAKGKPYTTQIVRWIRWRYQIPPATLRRPEELTVQQVAQHFGVNAYVVYYWIERNLIQARQLNQRMPYWITLNGPDEQKLQNRVRNSSRLQKGKVSPNDTAEGAL